MTINECEDYLAFLGELGSWTLVLRRALLAYVDKTVSPSV